MFVVDDDEDDDDDVDDDSSLDMIYLASKPYFRVGKMIAPQTMKIKVEKTFIHSNNHMCGMNESKKRHRTEPTSQHLTERAKESGKNVICNENK